MDERLPQTIAEAFACKFPEWNAEKLTRRGESCKSVDIEDVDDLKIFTDAGLEKLDVSETVRSALRAVKADLVPPASAHPSILLFHLMKMFPRRQLRSHA